MTQPAQDYEFQTQMQQLDALLQEAEAIADEAAREKTRQIIQGLMDFHSAAIGRMVERISDAGVEGRAMLSNIAADDLAGSLLVLYGLHPHDLLTRVRAALDRVRPTLTSHGRDVALISVSDGGAVELVMTGKAQGCKSTAATLRNSLEQAILSRAPEVTAINIKDDSVSAGGFVPLQGLRASAAKLHDLQGATP